MESATSTNTGDLYTQWLAFFATQAGQKALALLVPILENHVEAHVAAGTVIAAGAQTIAQVSITPIKSGNLQYDAWACWDAPGGGVVTPTVQAGVHGGPYTVISAGPQFGNVAASFSPIGKAVGVAFIVGVEYDFLLTTTAGDHGMTLGNGVAGISASLRVSEVLTGTI
jgi:hypothetical protein